VGTNGSVKIDGTLQIIGQEAFLDPDAGQAVNEETLMMMKDLPPNGTQQDDFFQNVLHKNSGEPISVNATIEPFGEKKILVVER
jgi:hypothetical protein